MTSRHEFLRTLHAELQPETYLEIGINTGRSLTLSRTRTIAVDPAFKITMPVSCDVHIVKATSDDFFAQPDALEHFDGAPPALAFIDGLHLFDFVLRDYTNVESVSVWSTVIVVDDILPRSVAEASRDRGTMGAWTGDVYKLTEVLRRHRPDLLLLPLDTEPTGVLVVLGADPADRTLSEAYDEIIQEHLRPDPQPVPAEVLNRSTALDPEPFLDPALWRAVAAARRSGVSREEGWASVRELVAAASRPAPERQLTPAALRAKPVDPTLSAGNPGRRPGAGSGSKAGAPTTRGGTTAGAPASLSRRSVRAARRLARKVRRSLPSSH